MTLVFLLDLQKFLDVSCGCAIMIVSVIVGKYHKNKGEYYEKDQKRIEILDKRPVNMDGYIDEW